ncbi:MAG: triphosphoribosyl-dephospho-CoA synthase MdcB [Chromatiales bacterium]|nr:triphosphoribosyl-dephospho-CoA synthase MdcB [Chromatiales bacterium]
MRAGLAGIARWERACNLRADGELLLPDGSAAAWRELLLERDLVLVKGAAGIGLRPASAVWRALAGGAGMSAAPAVACAAPPSHGAVAQHIARRALAALHEELRCHPKPGLVSPADRGSHDDMDAALLMRSLFAQRHYYRDIARAGAAGAAFAGLARLGRAAERRMLRATGGCNTHRGAIFSLGLLAAAAGALHARGQSPAGRALGEQVRNHWGGAILAAARHAPASHGVLVAQRFQAGGARAEAAAGFPHVFDVGLPALRTALAAGAGREPAALQCFFHILAVVPDTNLLYRGGVEGLAYAQQGAREFLARGGVHRHDWRAQAARLHREFVARRLSPGGAADLLAATLFVHALAAGAPA